MARKGGDVMVTIDKATAKQRDCKYCLYCAKAYNGFAKCICEDECPAIDYNHTEPSFIDAIYSALTSDVERVSVLATKNGMSYGQYVSNM